jgi:hypothetical protein
MAPGQQTGPTYTRHGGVRHMLAALDLATRKMTYRIRARKRRGEFLLLPVTCAGVDGSVDGTRSAACDMTGRLGRRSLRLAR